MHTLSSSRELQAVGDFKTGDRGVIHQGYLEILGRANDVFKVAGIKVSGPMVTDIVLKSGMVKDAWVMPFENANLGTVPLLAYVPKDENNFELLKLKQYLVENLFPQARPREYQVLGQIPRTGSGKVKREELREMIENARTQIQ